MSTTAWAMVIASDSMTQKVFDTVTKRINDRRKQGYEVFPTVYSEQRELFSKTD